MFEAGKITNTFQSIQSYTYNVCEWHVAKMCANLRKITNAMKEEGK